MRVLVVAHDVPYPPVHGGRVVMRNEIEALMHAGHEVGVVAYDPHRDDPDVPVERPPFPLYVAIPRGSFAASTLRMPLAPFQLSSHLGIPEGLEAQVRDFAPELVIAHQEFTGPTALRLAELAPGRPLVALRLHNNEQLYWRVLARNHRGARRLYSYAEYLRTRWSFGAAFYDQFDMVWAMTQADVPESCPGALVVPPALFLEQEPPNAETLARRHADRRVVFVGSLDMPQSIRGLEWFLAEVWPQVLDEVDGAELVIAGRNPAPSFIDSASAHPNVTVIANPPEVRDLIDTAAVFINPVFEGSGVNMKLGQPLAHGLPIVTTTTGSRGLSADAMHSVVVDDEPAAQAKAIIAVLEDTQGYGDWSDSLRRRADAYRGETVVSQMLHDVSRRRSPAG